MILSGNHDIFWIPACFDRLSNLRYWAWEKALKAFISRRARRARRERRDRLVARILRLTNSVHTSCPSGRSIQQFAPLPFLIIFMFSIASFFSVMLEWLYRASIQFLSGNHDIFWIPACFDRLSNLRYWAWEKALKAFISRRARRARRERRDRLVARILRLTNSVHTSCPSGRSIQQFAPLPFLIIFMFSIASFFSVMLECLYRASIQFLSGNHDIFWIPACFDRLSNLRE